MQAVDPKNLEEIVISAAREELLPRFARVKRGEKADGSVITEADLVVQKRIGEALRSEWPEIAFLAEEMTPEEQQQIFDSGKPVWILDPLDGTSNFSIGVPYFAVSLALLVNGEIRIGIVYDPTRDECFSASKGDGATLNGKQMTAVKTGLSLKQSTALVDFKRLPEDLAARLAVKPPYASQRSFGGVALDWCWIAAGRCQVYLHGKQNIWDYAAGHLVCQEAGGYSITLSGEPLFTNRLVPRAAAGALDKTLFEAWSDWLGITNRPRK